MRVWQRFVLGLLLAPLAISLAGPAQAVTVHGRSSTVMEWYDSPDEDSSLPVYQYLQFGLMNIAEKGYDFKLYGRLADDINSETDVDSRLYYAYVEKRDLVKDLDFRLGRQFISTTAGASLMDGLMVNYQYQDDYHIRVFGGGDVTEYENYDAEDLILGLEVGALYMNDDINVNLSYIQKRQDGYLDIELIGFDASLDLRSLSLYNETQYNIIAEQVSYQLLGGKYRFDKPFTLRLEYLYSLPVFSASSIYSVFAVEEYEEILAEGTWTLRRGLNAFARITHEMYDEFDDANVFELGLEKLRTDKFSGYISGVLRDDDDGQSMYGIKTRAAYRFMPRLEAGFGAEIDVLETEISYFHTDDSDQDETTSTRLWVFGTYGFTDKISLEGKLERTESDLWDYYYSGRLRLNILF